MTAVDFFWPSVAERYVPASAVVEALDVSDEVVVGSGFGCVNGPVGASFLSIEKNHAAMRSAMDQPTSFRRRSR